LAFPITLASRFYNSLYYRTSRDDDSGRHQQAGCREIVLSCHWSISTFLLHCVITHSPQTLQTDTSTRTMSVTSDPTCRAKYGCSAILRWVISSL